MNDDEKWLSTLLKDDSAGADDGFTDAVLARLPRVQKRKSRLSKRDVTLVVFGAVAGATGAFAFARGTLALDTPVQLLAAAAVIGLGLWAALSSADA